MWDTMQKDVKVKADIVKGKFQLVFMTPESLLLNLTWIEMFRSRVYRDNLAGLIVDKAHLVEKLMLSTINCTIELVSLTLGVPAQGLRYHLLHGCPSTYLVLHY